MPHIYYKTYKLLKIKSIRYTCFGCAALAEKTFSGKVKLTTAATKFKPSFRENLVTSQSFSVMQPNTLVLPERKDRDIVPGRL